MKFRPVISVCLSALLVGCTGGTSTPTASTTTDTPQPTETITPTETTEPVISFAEQIVGVYEMDEDTLYPSYLNVSVQCGIILLELFDGGDMSYRVMEVYPLNDDLYSDIDELMGVSYIYGDTISKIAISISQGDRLRLNYDDQSFHYEQIYSHSAFERNQHAVQNPTYEEKYIGTWGRETEDTITYLYMGADGDLTYLHKEKDLPITVYVGEWTYDAQEDNVVWIGTYLGTDPINQSSHAIKAELNGTTLTLTDRYFTSFRLFDQVDLVRYGAPLLVHENIYTQEEVYTYMYHKGRYSLTGGGADGEYRFRLPQLSWAYVNAQEINEAIYMDYGKMILDDLTVFNEGGSLYHDVIDYEYHHYENIISIIMYERTGFFGDETYGAYYYNTANDVVLDQMGVLMNMDVNMPLFNERVVEAAQQVFEETNTTVKQQAPDMYDYAYNRIEEILTEYPMVFYPISDTEFVVYGAVSYLGNTPYQYEKLYVSVAE